MLDIEELRGKVHVAICTPCYGGQVFQNYLLSIIKLIYACQRYDVQLSFIVRGGDSLIPRTRNSIVAEFMATEGYTHLLWVDADIGFQPEAVFRLLRANRDVAAGVYPLKRINFPETIPENMTRERFDALYTRYPFNPIAQTFHVDEDGFIEVLDAPTGLMLIKREVFTKMAERYPDLKIVADDMPGLEHIAGKIAHYDYRFFDVMTEANGRYLSEDYAFCLDSQTRVETEDGTKTIKWIVDNKYTGKVLSLGPDGKFVYRPVTAHWARRNGKRGAPEKTWVKIDTVNDNSTKAKLRCTSDHRIAVFDDVFDPQINYIPASESAGKYLVRWPDHSRLHHKENPLFGREQMSVVVGTLMGDASVLKSGQLSVTHSVVQSDYIEHKKSVLGGAITEGEQSAASFSPGKGVRRLTIPVNAQTRRLREMVYPDKKSCLSLLPMIDDIALSYWYMDDGSLGTKGNPTLGTYCYTLEEHEAIVAMLKERFGIEASIQTKNTHYRGQPRQYHMIYVSAASSARFFEIVAPYIVPTMRYKLPEAYRDEPIRDIDNRHLDFAASLVRSATPIKCYSKLYDIEVDETHNFVANGTLVHNCRRWQDIGGKIFVDAASNLTHQGSHVYTGNFIATLRALSTPPAQE